MLKTKAMALSLLISATLVSGQAFANSDNTINFQGEVSDETCSVNVNGNNSAPLVLMPTVGVNELDASGKVAGKTDFSVAISGCTGSTNSTRVSTVFIGNNVSDTGNLKNSGNAENVEIQLLDPTGAEINLTSTYIGDGDLTLSSGETEKSATYAAQYLATDVATAGTVSASLQYAVTYQ
ncbi:fimbrial protein [Pantoea allii]|jgi:major type 1 subunit fimbrin (pilin)|uniref:Major type 1 subunit fimbrin (Pilin) n=1 Tax=Pantoea allii TaxID=574096 RepID=A0A2V2BM47_9GAMM|nr:MULTISPECIES: fimbrial protein [Pantoea]MBW1213786.1 type 1 fimbrial protein [Pantoea allii]MBW1251822.1 type 1 fimbrial protein [Pantoea allii]MBW1256971.1 type 1 fimbrial protein [Pantoea allii]MBW1260419.1 type 1 fimbrial protein [Pantoea allii]MBW1266048.1 type 1 fimbrial protein [Pantoea allii]